MEIKAIYDNGGKTVDRYTVYYDEPTGNVYPCVGMSSNPCHPQGFGQHSEGILGRHNGKRIKFEDLPIDCQRVVLQDINWNRRIINYRG